MKHIIELIKEPGVLYAIDNHYIAIELKPGDKFKYQGKRYRTGHECNYFADIP